MIPKHDKNKKVAHKMQPTCFDICAPITNQAMENYFFIKKIKLLKYFTGYMLQVQWEYLVKILLYILIYCKCKDCARKHLDLRKACTLLDL